MVELGLIHKQLEDYQSALVWFEKAANLKFPLSKDYNLDYHFIIFIKYEFGYGVYETRIFMLLCFSNSLSRTLLL